MSNTFAPSFTAARLFEKTSAKGNMYMTGRMGSVRVTVMKSRETAEDGSPIWEMKFAEAAPYKPRDADPSGGTGETRDTRFAERSSAASPSTRASSGNRAAKANYAAPPRSVTDPPLSAGGVPAEYMEIPF